MMRWILRGLTAYGVVQLTVGLQIGIAAAVAHLHLGWSLPAALAVLTPLGLPLVLVQYPVAMAWLRPRPSQG